MCIYRLFIISGIRDDLEAVGDADSREDGGLASALNELRGLGVCKVVVLNQGIFAPQGTFGNVWGHFWLS